MSKNILAISGNDIFSGGGLYADLTTYAREKLHGFVAVTCLTAVTENGFEVIPVDDKVLEQQLASLKDVDFAAVKLGLLPNVETADVALAFVKAHADHPVVLDPVLVCKENHDLEVSRLRDELLKFIPYATIVTPNLVEAQLLAQMDIKTLDDMKVAAEKLHALGVANVVIKGGNRLQKDEAVDLFYDGQTFETFTYPILEQNNVGAGCTFASSIAAKLAQGYSVLDAVKEAKVFVYQAIQHADQYGVSQHF
ncbi:bifunctional hydroxymethylpyrimidine kinase/phosphomethylpyrimidine kinase [Streptococcus gallolyticus]|uniref:bifunctional hydroxymethylpyrimidine kinase/phosphomethylpyrimidine kinase n=1 Tax=Streptococcus hepaticus TaxID=3349163 RepID=UPI001C964589|nr:bifunctional hydroxymethylpyrimidine kinase/phosphomethylpyrimidine kinase [Streptococcus gallolyticus]MBY5040326.1 bifunctional hydroxymethylpyrimidine kinase/phosphomethylpyrimidine kinase [Streptococcus gallolyticus]